MEAVMWTDVVQTVFMFAGIVAVIIKGSIDHGGFSNIWSIMYDGDRIQFWEYVRPFLVDFILSADTTAVIGLLLQPISGLHDIRCGLKSTPDT